MFTARAARISYDQKKDLLILEGDGRTDAELYRQLTPGGAVSKAAATEDLLLAQDQSFATSTGPARWSSTRPPATGTNKKNGLPLPGVPVR